MRWVGGRIGGWMASWLGVTTPQPRICKPAPTPAPAPLISHTPLHGLLPGIGMHRDRYTGDGQPVRPAGLDPPTSSRPQAGVHACYSRVRALWRGQERLVSTYLSLGRGRKHVILLPPTAEVRATPPITHPTPHTSPRTPPAVRPTPRVARHSSHALVSCTPHRALRSQRGWAAKAATPPTVAPARNARRCP